MFWCFVYRSGNILRFPRARPQLLLRYDSGAIKVEALPLESGDYFSFYL